MRHLLLAALTCLVALVVQGPSPGSPVAVSGQAVERVEFRHALPSCSELIKQLGLEGQPVNCEEPPPPTYDPPQMHGNYRLFPETYVGPLTYQDWPSRDPRCTQSLPGCRRASGYRRSARTATTRSTLSRRSTVGQGSPYT
jgi:hypothetical protein